MVALFFLLAIVLLVSALGVVALKNPIHCALCLVANLLMVAVCFASLQAHFLAAAQVIVYAGAIMVLVLFMLMLLNIKVEKRTTWEMVLSGASLVVGVSFLAGIVPYLTATFGGAFGAPSVGLAPSNLAAIGTVREMGKLLFSDYVLLFQASGVLLMTAIVGAVMIARAKQR